ncbi:hypothetical protein [Sulfitobacter sp. S190]|nr:hypothetical protein [Sulfitobacter sp. S190]
MSRCIALILLCLLPVVGAAMRSAPDKCTDPVYVTDAAVVFGCD